MVRSSTLLSRFALTLGTIAATVGLAACGSEDDRAIIAVVGDSYTTGVEVGGEGDANWTHRLHHMLRRSGYRNAFVVEAGPGSGYVSPGMRGLTFAEMARSVPSSADVIIVFGSINDSTIGASGDDVGEAARLTYEWIRANRPDAELVVIGPSPVGDELPPGLAEKSEAVLEAARSTGATVIDPVADRWFMGADTTLISDDGIHPTDDGHQYMAEKIAPQIEPLLAEVPDGETP